MRFFTKVSFTLSILCALLLATQARADEVTSTRSFWDSGRSSNCFSPNTDPFLSKHLVPVSAYHETDATIQQINDLIWQHRGEIDPRLVYYRMFGESGGKPDAKNPSGAFGLFQFLGKLKGKGMKKTILALQAASPQTSPRLIQVKFYLERYLKQFENAANAKKSKTKYYGCNSQKPFSAYTNMEKVTYLGWGNCGSGAQKKEKALCAKKGGNASYKAGPCSFASPLIQGAATPPLCSSP